MEWGFRMSLPGWLAFISYVALGKILNLSDPQLSGLENGVVFILEP